MQLVLWSDVVGFRERAEGFLLAEEARHHLTLAILGMLQDPGQRGLVPPGTPILATIEAQGRVVATAVRQQGRQLVISPETEAALAGSPVLEELVDLVQAQVPDLSGVMAPPAVARGFAEAWAHRTGQGWRLSCAERSHALHAVRPVPPVPGWMRLATAADRALVVPWLVGMHTEIFGADQPFDPEEVADRRLAPPTEPGDPLRSLYLWDDGSPRAMAGAQGPTPCGVRIGAVYTPPEYRRRGYATNLVAALSQRMLDLGRRFCFLFTDLANPTANHIYAEIGYQPVFDVDELRFTEASGVRSTIARP